MLYHSGHHRGTVTEQNPQLLNTMHTTSNRQQMRAAGSDHLMSPKWYAARVGSKAQSVPPMLLLGARTVLTVGGRTERTKRMEAEPLRD